MMAYEQDTNTSFYSSLIISSCTTLLTASPQLFLSSTIRILFYNILEAYRENVGNSHVNDNEPSIQVVQGGL